MPLKSDPQIRQADASRLASREARPQAWAALLPQIDGTLSRTQNKQDGSQGNTDPVTGAPAPGSESFALNSTSKSWSLNLRESLFSWSNWMTVKQADIQVVQAEATYQAAQQNLILRVAQAYFNVLAALDGLEANQGPLEAISRQLDQANKRFEVGLIAITDVQEAKSGSRYRRRRGHCAKRTLATAGDQLRRDHGAEIRTPEQARRRHALNTPQPANEDEWVTVSLDRNVSLLSRPAGCGHLRVRT